MDIPAPTRRRWLVPAARLALAISIASIGATFTTPTRAQWIVNDPAILSNDIIEFGQDLAHWGETAQHYLKQVSFWQEQLVKIKSLNFKLFSIQQQFPKLPDDFGVKEACPGAAGGITGDITTALSNFTGSLTGDVTTQQQDICVLIELTKNRKYESTRLYLQQIGAQASALEQLTALRLTKVLQSPGKLSSYEADTGKYTADMMQAREVWKTNQEQLDAQIGMLERRQSVLARQALKGEPTTLGTLINMGALKAALTK